MTDTSEYAMSITRTIDAPRGAVWRCWTEGALLKQWFCPAPWTVPEADLDVRPGGRMNVTMAGPDGERVENIGCFLEVVSGERLVFTDAFSEGFMPRPDSFMTGTVELTDAGDGRTHMVWSARHATAEAKQRHIEMGFEPGWNAAADQLNDLARSLDPREAAA